MVDKKLYKPASIQRWIVVIYERKQRFSESAADDMVRGLQNATNDMGMFLINSRLYACFVMLILRRYHWISSQTSDRMGEPPVGCHCGVSGLCPQY